MYAEIRPFFGKFVLMLMVGKVLVSEELLEEKFVCDLNACKGECCVEGDSGAPLEEEETQILEEILPVIKPYLPADACETLDLLGGWTIDSDGDLTTPLVDGGRCAYTIYENGIAGCAIEKAWAEGKVGFRKPISCHLYPIRIKKTKFYDGLNYDRWDVCHAACSLGKALSVPVYKFLKDSLTRKYGEAWYKELEEVAAEYLKKEQKGTGVE